MPSSHRVLVVGPTWMGDMIIAQAMCIKLRESFAIEELHVLAPPSTLALTRLMPEVDAGIDMPVGHGEIGLKRRWQTARQLSEQSYDWAIITSRSFKAALIPFMAKIPRRTGFLGELRYGLINDIRPEIRQPNHRTIDRFLSILPLMTGTDSDPVPTPRLIVTDEQVEEALSAVGLERPDRPLLVLCPGADYGPAKRWPTRHFAELSTVQQRKGWAVWVLGSNDDREAGNQICDVDGDHSHNLTGRTTIDQAVALMSISNAVVSNDSGLMHASAALQKRTVGLFGSSSPERTPPLTDLGTALWQGLSCSPCFKRQCPLGHMDCLNQLTPQMVVSELEHDGDLHHQIR